MRRFLLIAGVMAVFGSFFGLRYLSDKAYDSAPAAQFIERASSMAAVPAGSPVTAAKPLTPAALERAPILYDPIVLGPCSLTPAAEQDVSSQIDGALDAVLVELGQQVAAGQILGQLDDRQIRPTVELLRIKSASKATLAIAKALFDEAEGKVKYAREANESGLKAVSDLELKTYLAQRERYAQEMVKAGEDQETAARELDKAQQYLNLHTIRSAISGEVVKVYKRTGEAVKQGEPLFRVASYHRLRVEGLCKAAQSRLLEVGMRAQLEPAVRGEPITTLTGHTGAIHSLAISPDGRVLASGGEDSVRLWRWPEAICQTKLPHPAEVFAVAFLPGDNSGSHLLTAGSDGRVRMWHLAASGPAQDPVVWPRAHDGAILCLAVSADGRWCATGGEDRRIGIWDLKTGQRLYWLAGEDGQAAHHGAVTTVTLTPEGHAISAARDNTVKVWKLGSTSATLALTLPGRTGDVGQLGTTPDGKQILFDHGEELRILRADDGTQVGRLQSRQQGHFQGVALFSPTGKLMLTGSSSGRLQLWQSPADPAATAFFRHGYAHGFDRGSLNSIVPAPLGGLAPDLGSLAGTVVSKTATAPRLWHLDASEVRHFILPQVATLCAAFAPDESVVFTAGSDKVIHAWAIPPASAWSAPLEASVTFIGGQLERGTDMVRVRAELDNPADAGRRLLPGIYATLRLYPETAKAKR